MIEKSCIYCEKQFLVENGEVWKYICKKCYANIKRQKKKEEKKKQEKKETQEWLDSWRSIDRAKNKINK